MLHLQKRRQSTNIMSVPFWHHTRFVKAKVDDPLLSKLSETTVRFLVDNGFPVFSNLFHFNLNYGLRTLQSALLENGGPERIRQYVDQYYLIHPAPDSLIAIGRFGMMPEMGIARYVCIDTNRNEEIVLFDPLSPRKKPVLLASSIERFFQMLRLRNSMHLDKSDIIEEEKEYARYCRKMARSMRAAMIAEEVPGFRFDKSLWNDILKSIGRGE